MDKTAETQEIRVFPFWKISGIIDFASGYGSVWSERTAGGREVAGSNPVTPTFYLKNLLFARGQRQLSVLIPLQKCSFFLLKAPKKYRILKRLSAKESHWDVYALYDLLKSHWSGGIYSIRS